MRHLRSGRKLNRTASHRKAMLKNLAVSILDKERVTTTVTKAKEVRSVVERLITYGKKASLHGIRLAERSVKSKDILKKLFDDIAPGYKDREGGYTRIIRLNERKGDNAEMAIIELVGRNGDEPRTRKKKKKTAAKKTKTAQKSTPKSTEKPKKGTVEQKKDDKNKVEKTEEKKSSVKPKEKPATKAIKVKKPEKEEKTTKDIEKKEVKSKDTKEKEPKKEAKKETKKETKEETKKETDTKDKKTDS